MTLSAENKALVERNHMGRIVGPEFFTISDITLNTLLDAARDEGRRAVIAEQAAFYAAKPFPLGGRREPRLKKSPPITKG